MVWSHNGLFSNENEFSRSVRATWLNLSSIKLREKKPVFYTVYKKNTDSMIPLM